MSATSAFGETLQFVTDVKLAELEKRRVAFASHSQAVLALAAQNDSDLVKKTKVLVEGIENWSGTWSSEGRINLPNIKNWLHQAENDPGFSPSVLSELCQRLESRFTNENTQFDYARLFGKLLTQWLTSTNQKKRKASALEDGETTSAISSDDFEKVNRKETMEQKDKFESLIFQAKEIDEDALKAYLDELFASKEATVALRVMRESLASYSESLRKETITTEDVAWLIHSLLSTDLLSDAKQATLKEFAENPVVMNELASVLNMQMASLSSWTWPAEGVSVDPRRHINGKVRFYLDYEVLTALLLQYIGMKWSIRFKAVLSDFQRSAAWKTAGLHFSTAELARRAAFMGENGTPSNIAAQRTQFQRDKIFMSQMPSSVDAPNPYDDNDDNTKNNNNGKDHVQLKQSLLHFLQADTLITKTIHGKCAIVRTDLEWFGPSLSHQSILAVLSFLGMPLPDLKFISAFLSCPLLFTGSMRDFQADPKAYMQSRNDTPRVRKRGTPIAHALSVLCGEVVMFIMDFAVNQRADGLFLYRIHDDFWFWDRDPEQCARAWKEMNRYADVAGLKFNVQKTGSIQIGDDVGDVHSGLPAGDIKWGLLRMDKDSKGKFIIDQPAVEEHIIEFQRQLRSTTSVFAWTQAYNKYMGFFIRNFGAPANVSGREHVDSIVQTLAKIQHALFPQSNGSFCQHLADVISKEFGMTDIPQGWFLWPTAAGGLQVNDPIVELLCCRGNLLASSDEYLGEIMFADHEQYDNCRTHWEDGKKPWYRPTSWEQKNYVSPDDEFFTFEEFARGREDRSGRWYAALSKLLQQPAPDHVAVTPEVRAAIEVLGEGVQAFGARPGRGIGWRGFSAYWKWIVSLHHEEMVKKYGSLAIVEPSLIPVGMATVFKKSRMRWEQ